MKQLDLCHKAVAGEVQEVRPTWNPGLGMAQGVTLTGSQGEIKPVSTIVSAHMPQHCTIMMVGFSSGLERKCRMAKLKMQTLWHVINELWEALGHMAEKAAVILQETCRDWGQGRPGWRPA